MSLRDAERLKDKIEVSLDSRQIFFLFFGGAVVACLVFVLGVMVGRRLENREQVGQRGATSAAVDPLAALDQLGADEAARARPSAADLEFPKALGQKNGRAQVGNLDLGKAEVVEADDDAPVAKTEDKKTDAAKADAAKPDDKKADAAKPAKAADTPVAKADDKKSDPKKSGKKAKFTLQLSSFQDRAEADAFAAKLIAAGHKPYIVQSNVPDKGTWFRVRLGQYAEHEEAIAAKAEFERTERVIAYVTRL